MLCKLWLVSQMPLQMGLLLNLHKCWVNDFNADGLDSTSVQS